MEQDAVNEPTTLFDVQQCERKGICKNCQQQFPMPHKKKFCSVKCRRAFSWRQNQSTKRGRIELFENVGFPPLRQSDQEAIELYTRKKIGVATISKLQGRSETAVKHSLKRAGVYRPDPKHNGTAKAGTGRYSRILQKERIQQRESEWRHKLAVCLWNLRRRVAIETTCHSNNWNPVSVWNHLGKRKSYSKWKASHPSRSENLRQYADQQTRNWRSRKYSSERVFAEAIKSALIGGCSQEKKLAHSRSRVDFEIEGSVYLECKISTRSTSFFRAMGQAIHYQIHERKKVWIVVPDDVSVRQDQFETLKHLDIPVLTETALRSKLRGEAPSTPHTVSTKTTVFTGFCKCCLKSGVAISRSPSGERRSYCVDCETEVQHRVFNFRQDRWIKRGLQ